MFDRLKDYIKDGAEKVVEIGSAVKDKLIETGSTVKDKAGEVGSVVKDKVATTASNVSDVVQNATTPKDECECLKDDWKKWKSDIRNDYRELKRLIKAQRKCKSER